MGPCRFKVLFAPYQPVVNDLETCTRVPNNNAPLRGCGLLDSLRKGRSPSVTLRLPAESSFNADLLLTGLETEFPP